MWSDAATSTQSSIDMRWLVPSLAILSFALTAFPGLMVLRSDPVSDLEIELLVGIGVFVIFGLLLLNILLALRDFDS
jgi:hypothetical protein